MIQVGIIGCGVAAQTFHLPFLVAPDFRVVAVASRKAELPGARRYDDAHELLAQEDIDLVVITAPSGVHFAWAEAALRAGKHVVVEKPMTTTLAEAQTLAELAERQGVRFSIFHNRRLDNDFLTVKRLIDAGHLGKVRVFRSHWDRFRPEVRDRWRENAGPGAGIWLDLGPHLVDQALCLFGMPRAVSATICALRPGSASDDYAHVQLHYDDMQVILHTSPYCAAPTPRFQVEGEAGTYVKFGLDPQEAQLKGGMSPDDPAFGVSRDGHGTLYHADGRAEEIVTERGRFADYYQNIAAAIRGEAALAVTPAEGVAVMQVLERARESAVEGRVLDI